MAGAYVEGILEMEEDLQHIELYRQWLNSEMRAKDLPRILGAKEFPKDEMKTAIIGQLGSLSPTVASDMVLFSTGSRVSTSVQGKWPCLRQSTMPTSVNSSKNT
jgi:hypothetical protein